MLPTRRARVSDPTGTFHVYAGQYQPEAAATLSKLRPPVFGAVVGKSRIYSPQAGTTYTSIRPEAIKAVDETVRDFWILEACRSLQRRLDAMTEAQKMDPLTKEMGKHLFVDERPPAVRVASLGDLGGAIGASLLVAR